MAEESEIGDDAYYDNLVLGAKNVEVDETNQELAVDAVGATNAHLGLYDVKKGFIDQSNSNIRIKGADGKSAVLNRVDGCKKLDIRQDNTTSVIEPSGKSKITAVNHITNAKDFTASITNSVIRIKSGGPKGGITAHTVIDGTSNVSVNVSGSIIHFD